MKVYKTSLSKTIDSVNDAIFFNHETPHAVREEVALWIAGRQGKPNAYANMFAPTASDLRGGIHLFTGECITSGASLRHVSGEEACRALIVLKSQSTAAKTALEIATSGMLSCLAFAEDRNRDMFCCGHCDPALWRHIAAGGLPGAEKWLHSGIRALKAHRDKKGKWRRFPFFYTLLALIDIDAPEALQEMRYAARNCEAYLAATKPSHTTIMRRRTVLERVLARC